MPAHAKNACCRDDANLTREETGRPDLRLERCQVCGARHFTLKADPGVIGVQGAGLGEEAPPPPSPWTTRRTTT